MCRVLGVGQELRGGSAAHFVARLATWSEAGFGRIDGFESMGRRRRVHTEVAVPGDGREAVGRDADERRVGRRIKWLLR